MFLELSKTISAAFRHFNLTHFGVYCHEKFGPGGNRSGRTNFGDQKWSGRTEYDAKICAVNQKLVRAHKYLVHVEISLSLCENELFKWRGRYQNGNLVDMGTWKEMRTLWVQA